MSQVNDKSIVRYEFASHTELASHWHMFGRIFQTSRKERVEKSGSTVAAGFCQTAANPDPNCEDKLKETINADLGTSLIFLKSGSTVDWWRFDKEVEDDELLVGYTLQYGVHKSDEKNDNFSETYFHGFRFALSKMRYFDVLYGKQEGLEGRRVKFKGQLPTTFSNLIVGLEVDVAANKELKRAGQSNHDSLKVFALYPVDFATLLSGKTK